MRNDNKKNLLEEGYHEALDNGDMEDLELYVNKKYNLKGEVHKIKKPSFFILSMYNVLNYFLIAVNFFISVLYLITVYQNFSINNNKIGGLLLGLFVFYNLINISNIVRIYSAKKYKPHFITLVLNIIILVVMFVTLQIIS